MAILKRTAPTTPDANVRVPLAVILHGTPADIAALTGEQRAVWRALASAIGRASEGSRYDVRHVLTLQGPALARWQDDRRLWAADLLTGDPRVVDE